MQSRESKVVSSKVLDASLVVTKCSGTKSDEHITSSSSGTYITHVMDADIKPVNNQVPSVEVHLIAQHNVLANEQQHTDQSEPSYDTYLLEKFDSNTAPDSTNISHRGREIDQDAEQDQVKSPLLKAEFIKMNDMVEKEVYNELSNRFLQLEKHPGPQLLTPRIISFGLVPQPPSPTPNVPPTKNDWDTLFYPMFDEYFNPSSSVVQPVLIADVQEPVVSTEVTEKQAGNVQTSLTLSSAKLEIQSMMDVPIHKEDPSVQRTPLIDTIISMSYKEGKVRYSFPQSRQSWRDLPRDNPLVSVEVFSNDDDNENNSDDDGNNEQSDDDHEQVDDERTKSNVEEEEKQDDEYVHTPDYYVPTDKETNDESKDFDEEEYEELYGDVNINLKDAKPAEKEKGDVEMTNTEQVMLSSRILIKKVQKIKSRMMHRQHRRLKRIINLEKDVKELKVVDHFSALLSTIKFEVPKAVKEYLGTSLHDSLQRVLQKHSADLAKEHSVPAKRQKTSKDVEPPKKTKSTKASDGTSKGTSKSQPKSTIKSGQAEETVFEVGDTQEPQNQGQSMGTSDDQPSVKAATKHDWFKKPERPLTPNLDWNVRKSIEFQPPQTWISKIAQAEKPSLSFTELMSTPIDFSAHVMIYLKIDKLTQEHLVGPTFNLLKGTCKSCVELEYNFKECYKALTDRLYWNNPEGKEYMFDLSKPLLLLMNLGRQVVPVDYFINNDLEHLRGGSSSKIYMTSTTKTKAGKYDIPSIEDMVPSLWSPGSKYDVYSIKRIIIVTKVMKWYNYGYLEEIKVRREDQQLYNFKEGDFPRLHLHDIEDMLLFLVQKKLFNLEKDVIFDLGVTLWMFTRCIVILKRVEDLQLGVKSYQKKLNITKPLTFKSDISNKTPYTTYNNTKRIIYVDRYKRNRLMHSDELYKFSDGTLTYVRSVLHDIASNQRMDYLPKRRWSILDRQSLIS
nr:hypothetical protein [Tanacetum cinerariifolium]